MRKSRAPVVPNRIASTQEPRGILELDRFDEASLRQWIAVSRDLDVLQNELYFGLEPERRSLRPDLIAALRNTEPIAIKLSRWVRVVPYQFSLAPLSCAGSLQNIGGRFNAGSELDPNTLNPWPALYLAQDYETAFREKFQLPRDKMVDGLTPEELALEQGVSHTALFVQGHLARVFDMTDPRSLVAVASVFRRVKMPARARELQRKLKIPNGGIYMAQTAKQLHDMVLGHNWRVLPIQFGLPAQSHVLAELVRAAGFEAILYQSTKGPGKCLAAFPDLLDGGSFVELIDASPPAVKHRRLDSSTAGELEGWESLPPRMRALF